MSESINSTFYDLHSTLSEAFLFDLDGTLLNTEPQYTEFWKHMNEFFNMGMPDLPYIIKGTTLGNILKTYFPEKERQEEIFRQLEQWHAQMEYPLFEGAKEFVLAAKAQGIKCAIVTSSDQDKMSNVVKHQGEFLKLFDAILTEEDFSESKPNPDCYLKAAARLETPINRCVVFEDAFTGLAAGMAANMLVVGLATGNPRSAIEDKCHHVIDNFQGITPETVIDWLENKL